MLSDRPGRLCFTIGLGSTANISLIGVWAKWTQREHSARLIRISAPFKLVHGVETSRKRPIVYFIYGEDGITFWTSIYPSQISNPTPPAPVQARPVSGVVPRISARHASRVGSPTSA